MLLVRILPAILFIPGITRSQVIAGFTAPDTVCVGTTVQIINTSTNATTNYWNFCTADLNVPPNGNNLGNIGNQFQMPVFIDYVFDNGNYYGFLVNNFPGGLVRLNFGNSLLNTPTPTNLGNVGVIPNHAEGIQVVRSQGNWYVIIVGGEAASGVQPRIVKIELGANIANNSPTGTDWGNLGNLGYPHDLFITQDNGQWIGLTVNTANNTITRFNFGTGFASPPSAVNLGNIGILTAPTGLHAIKDNNNWHLFVANANSSTISRVDFGNTLLNTPTGVNLGNIGGQFHSCWDMTIMEFCGEIIAFVINPDGAYNDITRLNFGTNILGIPTATGIGNIGNLNFPHCISKIFRVNADLYAFIPNVANNTLTRLQFTGCTNASIPNSTAQNPPPITYNTPGTYNINLSVDDGLPTQTSYCKKIVVLPALDFDFNYQRNLCNPLSVQFNAVGTSTLNSYWSFGDGNTATNTSNPINVYTTPGTYVVKYKVGSAQCSDTVIKSITLDISFDNTILTLDTTICAGTSKQLNTIPTLGFCWTPTSYLNDPLSPNPITSTPVNITYYFLSETQGSNLIVNGDFSAGNTGFTSGYTYANPNLTEGQYFVGNSPQSWNASMSNCGDHTTGSGNMMMINGSPVVNVNVWRQTINVSQNTNYAFSTWIQALWPPNPAQLQFSINGRDLTPIITAPLPTCTWTRFYTTWNSGTNTSATISIVNKNTQIQGNDFALDDIYFAPVFTKIDSVKIIVDDPDVQAGSDIPICKGTSVTLNATGANSYSWTPVNSLSNPAIPNPVANPSTTTQYIVTGTSAAGCIAKDSVIVTVNDGPAISVSPDTTICTGNSVQLFASGGISYSWSPSTGLNNPSIPNPVATPADSIKYYVTATGTNNCTSIDSVQVNILGQLQNATIIGPGNLCINDSVQLFASGGHTFLWQPSVSLDNPAIQNPIAFPVTNTLYSVLITDTICNVNVTLSTQITVRPLPIINAAKSNDIDCSIDFSQLNASGGIQYAWSPAASLNNPLSQNPVARPIVTTQYFLQGTDQYGCSNKDSITVLVSATNKGGYLVPNAFTPNKDGLNDCYGVKYWGVIYDFEFSIFNRWGQRIFYTDDPGKCWDGKFKGILQTSDVFVYMLKAKTQCEPNVFRKGTFVLIR